MDVDVAVLRSFVVLAEERHFARAAARLHIEQPALSQRIKRLERRTGVQLFVRDTRNVRLSAAGEDFAVQVAEILDRLDTAVARARETADGARGALGIAYTLSVGYEAVPVLLGHVEETLPHLVFEAVEAWERDVLDGVRRRQWDVGLVRFEPDDDELVSVLLRRERLAVAVGETHWLAGREQVGLADLGDEHFVMTPSSLAPGYQSLIEELLADAGVAPRTVPNAAPGNRMMALRRQKDAIALLPASARLAHPPGVCFVPVSDDAAVLPVRLVHRGDASAAVQLLADTVQREARRLGWLR